MDWFTRKVLTGRISNTLEAYFGVDALNEAIHSFGSRQGPLPRQHLHRAPLAISEV
ncbi:hypothetical protein [Mesorhizobium sp. CAU 1741]|uniref:hypothetical protein n=1 Tax=Mesorhizobium sp. CAU 1741 TaxID=3140366 RepID=UPI00325BD855